MDWPTRVAQLEAESPEFKSKVAEFLDGLISHYVFDDGKLVVAHAGMKEEMQGRGSGRFARLRSSARPPERRTISGFRFATTGRRTIVERRRWSTGTRRSQNRNG